MRSPRSPGGRRRHRRSRSRFRRDYELRFEESDGIAIHRFPATMALPPQVGHMLSRIVFRRWRSEERRYGAMIGGSRNLVDSYCHRAAARPSLYDAISLLGRGPHSLGLLARLVRSIRAYDVVLVGFMPFALIWQVLTVAKAFRKPVVLLALFHPEDLYHHFRVYYRCFADAAAILAQTAVQRGAVRAARSRGATGAGRARRRRRRVQPTRHLGTSLPRETRVDGPEDRPVRGPEGARRSVTISRWRPSICCATTT